MKNKAANRMLPLNTELLEFSRRKLRIGEETGARERGRDWEAAMIAFMCLLRASESGALEFGDVTLGG